MGDQGKLDLDAPLADYLERPLISYGEGQTHLAKYGPYRDLAGDERWRTITARMALPLGDKHPAVRQEARVALARTLLATPSATAAPTHATATSTTETPARASWA